MREVVVRRMAAVGVALGLTLMSVGCGDDGGDDEAGTAAEESTSTSGAPAATPTSALSRPLTGTLDPDTDYTVEDTVGPLTISFRTGADDLIIDYLPSTFYLSRPNQVTALSVSDLALERISEDSDPATAGPDKLAPVPADLLAWLAARPFFEVTEPRRALTAGEARGEMVTVRTKPLTNAPNPAGCGLSIPTCAAVLGREGFGLFTTTAGETTDFAVVEAGGTKALVIAAHDAAGQALLQSLEISTG